MKWLLAMVMLLLTACAQESPRPAMWAEPMLNYVPAASSEMAAPKPCSIDELAHRTKADPERLHRSRREVDIAVDCNKSRFVTVYRRALATRNVAGKVVLKFTIESEGGVSDAHAESSELHDQTLDGEIARVARTFQFLPYKGDRLIVTVPILFTPSM